MKSASPSTFARLTIDLTPGTDLAIVRQLYGAVLYDHEFVRGYGVEILPVQPVATSDGEGRR